MFDVIGTEIHLTRGNIAALEFPAVIREKSAETGEETVTPYIYQNGDIVRFKVMKKGDVKQIYLSKDVEIKEETEAVTFEFSGDETKFGDLINKPTTFWYEVELNPETAPQTILGYDKEHGPKLFILYPEGGDANV